MFRHSTRCLYPSLLRKTCAISWWQANIFVSSSFTIEIGFLPTPLTKIIDAFVRPYFVFFSVSTQSDGQLFFDHNSENENR